MVTKLSSSHLTDYDEMIDLEDDDDDNFAMASWSSNKRSMLMK